jgi:hypothetical protein
MDSSKPHSSGDVDIEALCLALPQWRITGSKRHQSTEQEETLATVARPRTRFSSLATSLPVEFIDMVFDHVDLLDLFLAAVSLP